MKQKFYLLPIGVIFFAFGLSANAAEISAQLKKTIDNCLINNKGAACASAATQLSSERLDTSEMAIRCAKHGCNLGNRASCKQLKKLSNQHRGSLEKEKQDEFQAH